MGRLVEQSIKTCFNGVSRQPPTVRLPGQVENADNVLFSVVTGGFEKRPGTQHISSLPSAVPGVDYAVHAIDRDPTEQYLVMVRGDGTLLIYDALTGGQKTVNTLAADAINYLTATTYAAFAFTSIVDYTFIVNSEIVVDKLPNPEWTLTSGATVIGDLGSPGNAFDLNAATSASSASVTSGYVGKDWGAGLSKTIVRCTASGIVGATTAQLQTSPDNSVWTTVDTQAVTGDGTVDMWRNTAARAARFVRLLLTAPSSTTISVAEVSFYEAVTLKGTKQQFSDLPATPTLNDVWEVTGSKTDNFDSYWVKWDGSTWKETVDPTARNYFDATTMPYTLVRNADGTFTFAKATWAPRQVGDEATVPFPSLYKSTISDVFLHRNRLGFLSDELAVFSQAGSYFDLWPEKATQDLDSDAFEIAASTNKVTLLKWAVPFRRSLFITSQKTQFEISALDKFTGGTAVIDLSTTYEASALCRPVAMGDTLYFPSNYGGASVIWEYFWDDNKFSSTAADITKHCEGYIPQDLRQMVASPPADRFFARSSMAGFSNKVFAYTTYWDGTQKLQSAWCTWSFGDHIVRGIATLGDYLYLIMDHGTHMHLEKVTVTTETADPALGYAVLLDSRTRVTGTYDAGNNWTTFTLPYPHDNNLQAVLSGEFAEKGRMIPILSYPTTTSVRLQGNYTPGKVYFGKPYTMIVELSKQYVRDQQNASIITGRCQMNNLTLAFKNSGYFEVHVTPEGRSTKISKMTGAILGSQNLVGVPLLISQGVFKVRVNSRADTVKIEIKNDQYVPSIIGSLTWVGFFNELSRQEQAGG